MSSYGHGSERLPSGTDLVSEEDVAVALDDLVHLALLMVLAQEGQRVGHAGAVEDGGGGKEEKTPLFLLFFFFCVSCSKSCCTTQQCGFISALLLAGFFLATDPILLDDGQHRPAPAEPAADGGMAKRERGRQTESAGDLNSEVMAEKDEIC